MSTLQLDMFATATSAITVRGGREIASPNGAWRAKWIGDRYGWVMYRLTSAGWESWEPPMPYGQAHIIDRDEIERTLLAEAARHGDHVLAL